MIGDSIDLNLLLAPLLIGPGGAGVDVRRDYSPSPPYMLLREARAAARAEERAHPDSLGELGPELRHLWEQVVQQAAQILATTAKDVEIAAWLTDALVRTEGLPGLGVGTRLISGLLDRYWDHLFPLPIPEDELAPNERPMDDRYLPIEALSGYFANGIAYAAEGSAAIWLRYIPLFRRPDGSPVTLALCSASKRTRTR